MKIEFAKKLEVGMVPVVVLKEGEKLERHPFFALFEKRDAEHTQAFQKKSPLKDGHNHFVFLPSGREVFLIGVPARAKWNHRKVMLTARRIVWFARRERVKRLAVHLGDFAARDNASFSRDLPEIIVTHLQLANFEFTQYKTPPPEGWAFVEQIAVFAKGVPRNIAEGLHRGAIIGEEVNAARALANTPGGDMTPARLAEAAAKAGEANEFKVTALDEKEIAKLKMGGILGVSKGSAERPRFIVMEYLKGKKLENPVVLVGKGVTFDTGGLNLKPRDGIYEMHMDMSGGAAVIHTIAALARLKAKVNVVGLVPAVENMPSGSSYHPGDLLQSMSGKTIEVLDTDAEGRIILADALTYAKRYEPRLIVDVATLTSAAVVAFGQRATALFTNAPRLERLFRDAGERTGDIVWPLPLWEEYEEDIKGTFGDVANVGKTRYGGAITAAVFLWQFIKATGDMRQATGDKKRQETGAKGQGTDVPWVHLDIAPRMTAVEGDHLAKGAAGASIALLVHVLGRF